MTRRNKRRLEWAGVAVCGLLLSGLVASWTHGAVFAREEAVLLRQVEAAAALQARTVESILAKYRHLPAQIAHRNDVRALFQAPDGEEARESLVTIARDVAGLTGASDIVFLDLSGRTVASAEGPSSTLGPDAARRAVAGALQGRLGRILVRSAAGPRGEAPDYAFSFPVRSFTRDVVGAVAVQVDLARIEETWALSLDAIRATDGGGALVVGNDRGRAEPARQGAVTALRPLPRVGWQLAVSRDARGPRTVARNAAWLAGLAVLALTLGALGWTGRRHAIESRLRRERAGSLVLERRVRDRTRALRAAQAELIQSAKLAALGRMSAALAHEYAQPLAAIRTYAENAGTLLDRDRPEEVPQVLTRIVAMAERMRSLSQTLRSFAREPGEAVRPVRLADALDDALLLAETEASRRGVRIAADEAGERSVVGGRVRSSQVILNLLSNAVAASPQGGLVRLSIHDEGETTILRVADDGPGVPEAVRNAVFDPFFTTRPVGEGLGLGLAIAYNVMRDFGGTLRLLPTRPGKGAVFEATFLLTRAEKAVAEEAVVAEAAE